MLNPLPAPATKGDTVVPSPSWAGRLLFQEPPSTLLSPQSLSPPLLSKQKNTPQGPCPIFLSLALFPFLWGMEERIEQEQDGRTDGGHGEARVVVTTGHSRYRKQEQHSD